MGGLGRGLTGIAEKHPAGATSGTKKISNPKPKLNSGQPTDITDEDFKCTLMKLFQTHWILIHKWFLMIFPLGLYMDKLKFDPKLK